MRWLLFAAVAWLVLFALALPLAAGGNSTIIWNDFCTPEPCESPVVDVHWRAAFLFAATIATVATAIVVGYTALVLRYRPDSYVKWLAAGAWVLLFVAGYSNGQILPLPGSVRHALPSPLEGLLFGGTLATVVTLAGVLIAQRAEASRTPRTQS